jgi:hypothetical protein
VISQNGWYSGYCSGSPTCYAQAAPSWDCVMCCEVTAPYCSDICSQNNWYDGCFCEVNGNGACGGAGEKTADCDYCCGW